MNYTENIIEIEMNKGNTILYYAHPNSGRFTQEIVGVDGETMTHRGNLLLSRCDEDDISFMLKVLCDADYSPTFCWEVLSGKHDNMHFHEVETDADGYSIRAVSHHQRRR